LRAFVIDLGGTHATSGIIEDRTIVARRIVPPKGNAGLRSLLPCLTEAMRLLRRESGLDGCEFDGVALGFCGLVNSAEGRVLSTNGKYPDATDIDLPSWAEKEFGLSFRIENDARMALLGEHYTGAAGGYDDVVMVTLGTGIGVATMIGGHLLYGKHFQAGCLGGHFPITLRGRACNCGGIGCAESEASGWALPQVFTTWAGSEKSALAGMEINFENLFRCAAQGDTVAMAIRQHCLEVWASNAVALVHAYDPEIMVFGGGVMRSVDVIIPYLQRHVPPRVWTPWGKVKICSAQLGNDAALLGAIPLLSNKTFVRRLDVR
jgi:glucokinase